LHLLIDALAYLDDGLHGNLSLGHFNGALLLLLRESFVNLELVEVEVQERLVLGSSPIEVGSAVLESL
jgi:hypothetical protein